MCVYLKLLENNVWRQGTAANCHKCPLQYNQIESAVSDEQRFLNFAFMSFAQGAVMERNVKL